MYADNVSKGNNEKRIRPRLHGNVLTNKRASENGSELHCFSKSFCTNEKKGRYELSARFPQTSRQLLFKNDLLTNHILSMNIL